MLSTFHSISSFGRAAHVLLYVLIRLCHMADRRIAINQNGYWIDSSQAFHMSSRFRIESRR